MVRGTGYRFAVIAKTPDISIGTVEDVQEYIDANVVVVIILTP